MKDWLCLGAGVGASGTSGARTSAAPVIEWDVGSDKKEQRDLEGDLMASR
jgi:hypothetical protein